MTWNESVFIINTIKTLLKNQTSQISLSSGARAFFGQVQPSTDVKQGDIWFIEPTQQQNDED